MKKILLIRSSSRAFLPALEELNTSTDTQKIDVLLTNQHKNWPKDNRVNEKIILNTDGFEHSSANKELFHKLEKNKYDTIVFTVNNTRLHNYKNIIPFVKKLDGNSIIAITPLKKKLKIHRFSLIWSRITTLFKKTYGFGMGIISLIFVLFVTFFMILPYLFVQNLLKKVFPS